MNSVKSNLKNKILGYYSEGNLTNISGKIIEAYKSKQYSFLIGIGNLISESLVKESQNIQKLFSQLIMLYHPDRLNIYQNEIRKLSDSQNPEYEKYVHIIAVTENLDNIKNQQNRSDENFDFDFEFGYDQEDLDSVISQNEYDPTFGEEENNQYEFDFISLIRYRELGDIDEELPSFYFEELEGELTLPDANLYDLSGLELCTNIDVLNLSNNQIVDINQIGFLTQLQEINLSGNAIHEIGVLDNLKNLKKVDLTFNEIDNIIPLLKLPNLEYLNVIGNNILQKQIDLFKKKKILFIY